MDPVSATVCELEGLVYMSGIQNPGIESSLASMAANACMKYTQGNYIAARNILSALVNEVDAQCGNQIPEEVADILVTFALASSDELE